jgi:hypothetical protein
VRDSGFIVGLLAADLPLVSASVFLHLDLCMRICMTAREAANLHRRVGIRALQSPPLLDATEGCMRLRADNNFSSHFNLNTRN